MQDIDGEIIGIAVGYGAVISAADFQFTGFATTEYQVRLFDSRYICRVSVSIDKIRFV